MFFFGFVQVLTAILSLRQMLYNVFQDTNYLCKCENIFRFVKKIVQSENHTLQAIENVLPCMCASTTLDDR